MPFFVYILKCADGSYYIGSTSNLEVRLAEHQSGFFPDSYTASRRPVQLVWSQECANHDEAFRFERQIKGWNRKKKEALIRNDFQRIHEIVTEERLRREAEKPSKPPEVE
mgnify:CR=1 FL=1